MGRVMLVSGWVALLLFGAGCQDAERTGDAGADVGSDAVRDAEAGGDTVADIDPRVDADAGADGDGVADVDANGVDTDALAEVDGLADAQVDGLADADATPDGDAATDGAVDGALDAETQSDAPVDTAPDAIPDALPDVAPDAAPDATPDAIPDAIPDAVADTTPDAIPDAVADTTPDAIPDAIPDAVADTTPDAVPDAAPDAVADAVLDAAPDAVADADADAGPDLGPDVAGLDLPPFSYATTCHLGPDPSPAPGIAFVNAFPKLPAGSISEPIDLTHANDGSGRIFVNERAGRIRVFAGNAAANSVKTFLDISDRVYTDFEGGFLGLAFHPNYAETGEFFVNYTRKFPVSGQPDQTRTVISRFHVSAADPDKADPTEEILLTIDQFADNHNGGKVAFGPDGYLYIGMGDGGGSNDPLKTGQNAKSLLGAMLRIDIDSTGEVTAYGIPADNPFAGATDGKRPEIYAMGLRNPWRFSFDRLTGVLWCGDVGQNTFEEVDIIERGHNYGWSIMEANACFPPSGPQLCDPETLGLTLPVAEYDHSVGASITGGYVYRGSTVPSLYGAYLYADYSSKRFFAWKKGEEPPPEKSLISTPTNIGSFGEDENGEVYLLGLFNNVIYKIVQTNTPPLPDTFPKTLSATGCFEDLATLTPAAGVLPYDVNVPLWADSALKSRFVVLPEGGKLGYAAEGPWTAPDGTIFIKHFAIDTTEGDPQTRVRLETRFLIKEADGLRGYTYRWNDAGTEAFLLDGAATRTLDVTLADAPAPVPLTWRFPSRQQCSTCHSDAAGGVLGFHTGQINRPNDYGTGPVEQILALAYYELLAGAPPQPLDTLPRWPAPEDTSAPAADRARAWLAANCANCHLPGGPTGTSMDLRYETPLADTGTCATTPQVSNLGVMGAELISPGAPDHSVIWLRMQAGPADRMPPISTSLDPDAALTAIVDWITALESCSSP
ncbi:MAG: PQQ-dependent sugar dehydrogenase [Myxococcota bacterium]